MKKILTPLCVFICTFAFANAAIINTTVTDITTFSAVGTNDASDYNNHGWGDVNYIEGAGDFVSWTHNFIDLVVPPPPASQINGGVLTLSLRDDSNSFWDSFEVAITVGENGSIFAIQEVDTDDYDFDVSGQYLEDGTFDVIIGSLLGDFYIDQSTLEINYSYDDTASAVPEPSTYAMFGIAFLGLGFVGYRKRRAA